MVPMASNTPGARRQKQHATPPSGVADALATRDTAAAGVEAADQHLAEVEAALSALEADPSADGFATRRAELEADAARARRLAERARAQLHEAERGVPDAVAQALNETAPLQAAVQAASLRLEEARGVARARQAAYDEALRRRQDARAEAERTRLDASREALDAAEAAQLAAARLSGEANDAEQEAEGALRAAREALASVETDTGRSQRIEQLLLDRLADLETGRATAVQRAADASAAAAQAAALVEERASALRSAEALFDADPSNRSTWLEASAALAEQRTALRAAQQQATAASDGARAAGARVDDARRLLAGVRVSRGYLPTRTAPIVARMKAALRELMLAHGDHREVLAAFRAEADLAGDATARAGLPGASDLARRAAEELRAELRMGADAEGLALRESFAWATR